MQTSLRIIAISFCLCLSACASTPDPAKVCTANWIEPRAERAVDRIEKRAGSAIKTLAKASKSLANGKTPGPLTMFSLNRAFERLKTELTKGRGVRDLQMLSRTCNDPDILKTALRGMMVRRDIPDRYISAVENSPIYDKILEGIDRAGEPPS